MNSARTSNTAQVLERSGIRVVMIQSLSALREIADDWNRMAERTPQHLPMLSYAWLASYFEHRMTQDQSWAVLLAYCGENLVGVFPFLFRHSRHFGIKRMEIQTPSDDHIASVDFLAEAARADTIVPTLIEALNESFRGNYCLTMSRLPESSPGLSALSAGNGSLDVIRESDGMGSYLPISATLDDTLQRLSSNFRKNLKKARKKLAMLPNVETEFTSGSADDDSNLELLMQVEASGWKGRSGTAILNSQSLVEFYRALTRRLAEAGWLEWHFLKTDGRVIAAQMATKLGRSLILCKIAYDEENATVSPGNMLFEKTVERCIERGDIDEIDCLTDMAWHRNWQMEQRPHYRLSIYPRRLTSWMTGSLPARARRLLGKSPVAKVARDRLKSMTGESQ
ncbi:MAG: GNAT family N-acetyltransferase [candidate division Zixibacteria bacterium]|nr:GNAT family N-acetyltransferase [candidate division Zixibacteria bacterium]MBU1472128.1 GNAT family N-acetyltransferase [candidate division Zixibacteria bacterium]MBU2626827.1 GNAT family N-acetyltransferase [candidate division Zixibacteria bacterium]